MREKLIELLMSVPNSEIIIGKRRGTRYATAWHIADHLIANGVTVQKWIPASEPPKDTYEYWIAYKAGGDYFYSTGYFDGKCWRSAITHKQIPVTHWQYLPQPPKGE